jgi:hypothetical protein
MKKDIVCSLNGINQDTHKLALRVTGVLNFRGQQLQAIEFNNRLWCCCNFAEALELSKQFVQFKDEKNAGN